MIDMEPTDVLAEQRLGDRLARPDRRFAISTQFRALVSEQNSIFPWQAGKIIISKRH